MKKILLFTIIVLFAFTLIIINPYISFTEKNLLEDDAGVTVSSNNVVVDDEQKVIYLSPSTQEYNIGFGDYGTEEYRMNKIADILEDILINRGYVIFRNKPDYTLLEIINESNSIKPDIHVALHSNGADNINMGKGTEIYTSNDSRSHYLANKIFEKLSEIYPHPEISSGVLYSNFFYEITKIDSVSVLIEIAFHDNEQDAKWIMANEEKIAQVIADAIDDYFSIYPNAKKLK